MLSRLIILSCAREIVSALERAGVACNHVDAWNQEVTRKVCQPCASADQARVVELQVSELFRTGLQMLEDAYK